MTTVKVHERIGLLASQGALDKFKGWEAAFPELPEAERYSIAEHLRSIEEHGEAVPPVLWVGGDTVRDPSGEEWVYPMSAAVPPDPAPTSLTPFDPYKARKEALALEMRIAEVQVARAKLGYMDDPELESGIFGGWCVGTEPGLDARFAPAPLAGDPLAGRLWNIDRKMGGAVYGMPGYAGAVLFETVWPVVRGLCNVAWVVMLAVGTVMWWIALWSFRFMWEFSWVLLRITLVMMTLGLVGGGKKKGRR